MRPDGRRPDDLSDPLPVRGGRQPALEFTGHDLDSPPAGDLPGPARAGAVGDEAEGQVMAGEFDPIKEMKRMGIFIKNRQAFPLEELEKYEGQWVAWRPDGTHIVAASSTSEQAVWDGIAAAGYDPQECVFSYVPRPDEHFL